MNGTSTSLCINANCSQSEVRNLWDIVGCKFLGRTSSDQKVLFKHATGLGIWYAPIGADALEHARPCEHGREIPSSGRPGAVIPAVSPVCGSVRFVATCRRVVESKCFY